MLGKLIEYKLGTVFRNPARVQEELLRVILLKNKNTKYGENHNFSSIKTVEDFQNKIPEVTYQDIYPYIEEIKRGVMNVLTIDPVEYFATSSGTTDKPKFIPITKQRYKDFIYEQILWTLNATRHNPKLFIDMIRGKILYFTGAKKDNKTEGDIPYGPLSGYIGDKQKERLKGKIATSNKVFEVNSFDEKMKLYFEESTPKDVRQVFFAYPVEIALFLKYVAKERGVENMKLRDIWKNISLIACFKNSLKESTLEKFFDEGITIMDGGIRGSEGTISIGYNPKDRSGVPAIQETFLEFKECDSNGKPILIQQLEEGKEYEIIMTTPYGLYRYNVGDIIRVTGRKKKLPLIEFVGRNKTFNIAGEKSPYNQIEKSIEKAKENTDISMSNYMIVPNLDEEMPYYEIIMEENYNDEHIKKFLREFDAQLQKNILSYKRMRNSFNRLQAPRASIVPKGTYEKINKERIMAESQPKIKHIGDISFKDNIVIEKTISP